MLKRYWGNGFATGLTVGICITIITLLIVSSPGVPVDHPTNAADTATLDQEASSQKDDLEQSTFGFWMRRLFSFEDTIAQWTMTVFSIVAAYFLWRTLLTTRRMSIAQSRAYVHVSSATVQWVNRLGQYEGLKERDVFSVVLSIENTGHTPAKWYEISGDSSVLERDGGAQTLVSKRPARVMRWGILPPNTPLTCPYYAEDISRQLIEAGQTPARIIRLDGSVKYETEFNEIRETPFSFYVDGLLLHDVPVENDRTKLRGMKLKMTRPQYQ